MSVGVAPSLSEEELLRLQSHSTTPLSRLFCDLSFSLTYCGDEQETADDLSDV